MQPNNIISLHSGALPLPAIGKVEELAKYEHYEIPGNIYYTPEEVWQRFGIACVGTLANWRCQGKNLVFHKGDKNVSYPFYGKRSISLFLKHGSKTSTSTEINA